MVTGTVHIGLWKGWSKEESAELGFELKQSGEISQTARQWKWTDGAMKLKECSPKEFKLCSGIFKSLSLEDWCVHVWSVIVHSAQILALLKIKSKCAIYFFFYVSYDISLPVIFVF